MDRIAIELSKLPFIETINALKQEIDSHKPIAKEVEDKVFQKLKLDWNYNSNAIEGNKLNYGETVAFLMHGITAKGKTLKDHLDIKGHNEAITFLLGLIKEERDISETDIRALHEMILVEEYETDAITEDGQPTKKKIKLGTYKTTPNSVKTRTGEMHHYASVEETPVLMKELMDWYNENKTNPEIHPLVLASLFHFKFVAIHPFDDGNGRLARILMNLILLRHAYPVVVVKNEDKQNYYGVLAQADSNQFIPLIEYMSDLLQHSLNLYLKGIKGESIEEESDIDKEIALLKKSINSKKLIIPRNKKTTIRIIDNDFSFLVGYAWDKLRNFNDLFSEIYISIDVETLEENNIKIPFNPFVEINSEYLKNNKIDLSDLKSILFGYDFQKPLTKIEDFKRKHFEGYFVFYFYEHEFVVSSFGNEISKDLVFSYDNIISENQLINFVNNELKRIIDEIKEIFN